MGAIMSDFNLSKSSYYADFVTVPLAILGTIICALVYGAGDPSPFVAMAGAGFAAWTLIEYATHRYLFHVLYRREHWTHHLRPRANIGVPFYLTAASIFFVWLATIGSAGVRWGGGLFVGLMVGYLTYIVTHHWIHRYQIPRGHFLRAAHDRHNVHHRGKEVNFNVLIPLWDRVFGTFEQPRG